MSDRDQRVRERAYHLWERAGRPEHGGEDFWHRAHAEIEAEGHAPPPDQPDNLAQPESPTPHEAGKQAEAAVRAPAESLRMAPPATPPAAPKTAKAPAEKPKAPSPKAAVPSPKPGKSTGKARKKP